MKAGLLFPGQGSQYVGMGKALYDTYPAARDLYDQADALLGTQLRELSFHGPLEELTETRNAQPAILLHSVAAFMLAEEKGLVPDIVAGHSLGEFSGLVAAGSLSALDAVRVVRRRGELMFQAGEERPGTMAAILGMSKEDVEGCCQEASDEAEVVVVANENSPGQIAVSGDVAAVKRAMRICKERGGKAIPLKVSGAFHSPLMAPARVELEGFLQEVDFRDAACDVIANVTGRPMRSAETIRSALGEQLTSPVLWAESMKALISARSGPVFEVGPGRVLTGLLKKIDADVAAEPLGNPDDFEGIFGEGKRDSQVV